MHRAASTYFTALLLGLGLLVCTGPVAAREPVEVALVRQYFAAMHAKDRAAVAALLAPDAVFEYAYNRSGATEPGSEKRFVGREVVMTDFVDRAFALMSVLDWTDPGFTVSADRKTVFVEMRGNMVLGQDVPYRNKYVVRFDLRHGAITGMREYMNTVTSGQALEAAGMLPQPAR